MRLSPDREITREEWVSWMQCSSLVDSATGRLKDGNQQDWLFWDQGAIQAQNPSEKVVGVMLEAARDLSALVVSEKRRPFVSLADWREQTHSWRVQYERGLIAGRQRDSSRRRRRLLTILAGLALGLLLSWILSRT